MFKPLVQFKQVFLHFNPCVFTEACFQHKCGFNSQQCVHNTRTHTSPFGNRPEKTSELLRAHNGAVSSWMPKWPDCLAGFQIVGVCVSLCVCVYVFVCVLLSVVTTCMQQFALIPPCLSYFKCVSLWVCAVSTPLPASQVSLKLTRCCSPIGPVCSAVLVPPKPQGTLCL